MPDTYLDRAIADGHAKLVGDGKAERIHHLAIGHSERWSDPEEKVRAEYWAELIYRYQYVPQRIGVEVTVPDRTPKDSADLVVFHDDERKSPYAVIECKRDGITDAELKQATEQRSAMATRTSFARITSAWWPANHDCSSTAATNSLRWNGRRVASPTCRSAMASRCASSIARMIRNTTSRRCRKNA